jgi:hypothetical protein
MFRATPKSRFPSPLKSAEMTAEGAVAAPVENAVKAWKVPSTLPRNTEIVLSAVLATAKSGMPSLLKSPTANDCGPFPDGISSLLKKYTCASALSEQTNKPAKTRTKRTDFSIKTPLWKRNRDTGSSLPRTRIAIAVSAAKMLLLNRSKKEQKMAQRIEGFLPRLESGGPRPLVRLWMYCERRPGNGLPW